MRGTVIITIKKKKSGLNLKTSRRIGIVNIAVWTWNVTSIIVHVTTIEMIGHSILELYKNYLPVKKISIKLTYIYLTG